MKFPRFPLVPVLCVVLPLVVALCTPLARAGVPEPWLHLVGLAVLCLAVQLMRTDGDG